jgi:hypothetical protein
MGTTINYGRMILGGFLAALVLFMVGYLTHGVFLKEKYLHFQEMGSVLAQPREMGMPAHLVGTLVSGFALSMIWIVARVFGESTPATAIKVGFVVGLFTTAGVTAEYAFYNLGAMIPLMTLAGNIVGAILGIFAAGIVYKD